ncbi:hypothetical protein BTA51_20250 [Hahella sp. CCB-MM4]|uniref:sensor domain-containing diguanylate cyclase n=1 Tax=Hahella sp. (strain CCB-MM4) TaxID=1926491 RepID=UPI000BD8DFD8|nr:diguanylate cyclase [Hahella sp. CCB-MM4]OZG71613.1 hypothetical protein BTA51_20250 [Hahella sp. CCB-MM4]
MLVDIQAFAAEPDSAATQPTSTVVTTSAARLPISTERDVYNLAPYVSYYEDKDSRLSFYDIFLQKVSPHWITQDNETLSFGYSDATYWLVVDLENIDINDSEWFLEVGYPVLDEVDIFITEGVHLLQQFNSGDNLTYNSRLYPHRNFVFPLNLQSGQPLKIYLRVRSETSIQVPLKLYSPTAFHTLDNKATFVEGIYYGFMLIMALYNLFLYFSIKQSRYLYYVAFICCFSMFQLSLSGFAYQYLWPESVRWNQLSLPVFLGTTLFFMAMFVNRFLNLPEHKPWAGRLLISGAILALAGALLSTTISYRSMILFMIAISMVNITLALILGIQRSMEKDRAAQYFTLAWFSSLMGAIILALNKIHLIPRNFATENALQIGTAIEVVLISFALGEYVAQQRRARAQAQQESMRMEVLARMAQEDALAAEKKYSAQLEVQVNERTNELQKTLHLLEKANHSLEKQSHVDELTNVFNRRYFNQRYEMEVKRAARDGTPLSLIMIDIDHFKRLNDNYGHLFGDLCLRHVALILEKGKHRPGDTVARYGGEEFVMLLPVTPLEGAMIVAERIRGWVEHARAPHPDDVPHSSNTNANYADAFTTNAFNTSSIHPNSIEPNITISLGVATLQPESQASGNQLLQLADEALYMAKENGRNQVCSADSKNFENTVRN